MFSGLRYRGTRTSADDGDGDTGGSGSGAGVSNMRKSRNSSRANRGNGTGSARHAARFVWRRRIGAAVIALLPVVTLNLGFERIFGSEFEFDAEVAVEVDTTASYSDGADADAVAGRASASTGGGGARGPRKTGPVFLGSLALLARAGVRRLRGLAGDAGAGLRVGLGLDVERELRSTLSLENSEAV